MQSKLTFCLSDKFTNENKQFEKVFLLECFVDGDAV